MVPVVVPRTWQLVCRAAGHGPGTAAVAGHGRVQWVGYGRRPLSRAAIRRPVRKQQRHAADTADTSAVAVWHAVQVPDTRGRSVASGVTRAGLAWHNHHRLDRTLETVRWEAQAISRLLGTRAAALLCVHGAHVHGGGLHAHGVAIVPAGRLRDALGQDRVLSDADVQLLAPLPACGCGRPPDVRRIALASRRPLSPVQTFSPRSTKRALKQIGLLHRSRHRGRDIKVAAVVYPQTTHEVRSPDAPPGEKVLNGVGTHQGGPRTFRAADGSDQRAQGSGMAGLCDTTHPRRPDGALC